MFDRKKLYRERLEMYLVYLMLGYRPFILLTGLIWVLCAAYAFTLHALVGGILLVVSALLLALGSSFGAIVGVARAISWLAVLFKREF